MSLEREILKLFFGLCALIFVLLNWQRLTRLPRARIILGSFFALIPGWFVTVFDERFWQTGLNAVEHLSYTTSMILLAIWCASVYPSRRQDAP